MSAISADGSISARAIVTTELAAEAARLQGLGGLAAAALGRALTCSLLVADGVKEDETFQVKFDGCDWTHAATICAVQHGPDPSHIQPAPNPP